MLNRDSGPIKVYGVLLGVEIETGVTTPEQVAQRLADSLAWLEGVGNVTVDVLGEIDVLDGPADNADTVELLPPIPGHAHRIGADGQPTCGCSYTPEEPDVA